MLINTDKKERFSFLSNLKIDWILLISVLSICFLGLLTMTSFESGDSYFYRQFSWLCVSIIVFFILSFIDYRFLKKQK